MKIYLLSGLGADERLFSNLKPIAGFEYVPLKYVKPGSAKSLSEYAQLMVDAYDFEPPFILGGVSIGGMIAQEMAQIIRPEKLILISTICFRQELPEFFRIVNTKLTRSLLEKSFLEIIAKAGDKFTRKSEEGRRLFFEMLHASDPEFLKFGAGATMSWQPPASDIPIVRLHGSKDKVFPISRVNGCVEIKNGEHFMIFEKGAEISRVLAGMLHG